MNATSDSDQQRDSAALANGDASEANMLKPRRISTFADAFFKYFTGASALLLIFVVCAIVALLVYYSIGCFKAFGFKFPFTLAWNPMKEQYGAAGSIIGTLMSTGIAMLLAVPFSLVIALFLVELAHPVVSKILGTAIELLAAVPSIIFGMWGLFVFAPFLAKHVCPVLEKYLQPIFDPIGLKLFAAPYYGGLNILTAGIILAIMILPFITAVVRDVLTMVPPVVKESAHGMGATPWEVTHKVTFKYGLSGIIGGTLLGLGRAIGETMAVAYVIGNSLPNRLSFNLFSASNSIPSTLANQFNEAEGLQLSALIAMGLILFLITFCVQIIFHFWMKSVRKKAGRGL